MIEGYRPLDHSCFWTNPSQGDIINAHDLLINSAVEFMLRTVFVFLDTHTFLDLQHRLQSDHEEFDTNATLSCISLYLMTLHLVSAEQDTPYVRNILRYGRRMKSTALRPMLNIFSRLDILRQRLGSINHTFFVFKGS